MADDDDRSEGVAAPGWGICPGCGVELPEVAGAADPRTNPSVACRRLYGEVYGYEYEHLARLGRFHQLIVDAYGAQHGGSSSPSIGTAFGLIGLHLAPEEGWSGMQIRDAHQDLAGRFADWPVFDRPASMTDLTIFDVAMSGSPDAHADIVERWAAAVWASWEPAHPRGGTAHRGASPGPRRRPTIRTPLGSPTRRWLDGTPHQGADRAGSLPARGLIGPAASPPGADRAGSLPARG